MLNNSHFLLILLIFIVIPYPASKFMSMFALQWALMTLLDPARTIENLIYVGYPRDPASAIRITRKRRVDRKKQQSDRNVFQCFVFGPKNAGKSALLNSFLGRSVI